MQILGLFDAAVVFHFYSDWMWPYCGNDFIQNFSGPLSNVNLFFRLSECIFGYLSFY